MKRLTKSQYEAIAAAFRASKQNIDWASPDVKPVAKASHAHIARHVAHKLSLHDTEFRKNEFLELCGIED